MRHQREWETLSGPLCHLDPNEVEANFLKMKVNIVRPSGEHSGIFAEWAELMCYAIQELGHETSISIQNSKPNHINIVIGIFYPDQFLDALPEETIVINTEPLFGRPSNPEWTHKVIKYASRYRIWDYDLRNIEIFKGLGIHDVQHFQFGYQPELERIPSYPDSERPVDFLFYGSTNQRRKMILDKLSRKNIQLTTLFNCYGRDRDERIARSKIVINIHHEDIGSFEIVRNHYLLNNGVAIASEISATTSIEARYLECVVGSEYSNFESTCHEMIENPSRLIQIREKALMEFKKHRQVTFMEDLLKILN